MKEFKDYNYANISFKTSQELKQQIRLCAYNQEISVSELIRRSIENYLRENIKEEN